MRPDAVSPALRVEVLERDAYRCVAPRLGGIAVGFCRNRWNQAIIASGRMPASALTLDHVKEQPMMGKRAPSDRRHLVTLCWHHHLNGWATANRPALREYIALAEGRAL